MYLEELIIPEKEIKRRILSFKRLLNKSNIDFAIIVQNADMLYFTGIVQQGIVLISAQGEDLFLVKKNLELALSNSKFPKIIQLKSLKDLKNHIPENSTIGFEGDIVPYNNIEFFKSILGNCRFVDISNLIRTCRAVKSEIEIEYIKKSSLQYKELCNRLPEFIHPGKTEQEIFVRAIQLLMEAGHQGFARMRSFSQEMFFGHILGTDNGLVSSYLDAPTNGAGLYPSFPQGSSFKKLEDGCLLSIDLVTCFNGYHCDQARPFQISSKVHNDYIENFKKSLEILYETLEVIKPGETWEKAYFKSIEISKKLNVEDSFMLNFSSIKFVGHGIGLEVDEFPFLAKGFKNVFIENMVFALEPKIFIKDKGVVGIENTYRITSNGVEKLTQVEDKVVKL